MSIDLTRHGGVAVITINYPERLNALSSGSLIELTDVLTSVGEDRAVRVVILTGAGDRAFVAGANIAEMAGFSEAQALDFGRLGHAAASAIENLPQPVIAAVNGYAFGGGCELALAADIRMASSNAEFAQPEVKLGIPPGWGGSQRLPRVVGPGMAAELILSGRRVRADEALQIGLVNSVHESGALLTGVLALANEIAANSPHAVRTAKRLLNPTQRGNPDSGLAEEAAAFARAFSHPDQKKGMTAFLEKRTAEFEDEPA